MPIIRKEQIIAKKNQTGRRVLCQKCMSDRDFQKIARNEILLRVTIEQLYSQGNIIFCDGCDINIYRFVSALEENKTEESSELHLSEEEVKPEGPPVPHVSAEEIPPQEPPAHLYEPEFDLIGKEGQLES
jgi:hypothetical protein